MDGILRFSALLGSCGASESIYPSSNIYLSFIYLSDTKGTSYHWDMMVVGCLNIPLSIFCMPWMHAVLPHSPLHVRALADIDEHVEEGHVYDIIVKVRETRVSNLVSNILIGVSVHLIPRSVCSKISFHSYVQSVYVFM